MLEFIVCSRHYLLQLNLIATTGLHSELGDAIYGIFQVSTYLTSKTWETRIAAGQAVEAIARNTKQWEPVYQPKKEVGEEEGGSDSPVAAPSPDRAPADLLSFETFDIQRVSIAGCTQLVVHSQCKAYE